MGILTYLKYFCIPMTFNNPNDACFMNKKYTFPIETCTAQIENSILLIQFTVVLTVSFQIIGEQKY